MGRAVLDASIEWKCFAEWLFLQSNQLGAAARSVSSRLAEGAGQEIAMRELQHARAGIHLRRIFSVWRERARTPFLQMRRRCGPAERREGRVRGDPAS